MANEKKQRGMWLGHPTLDKAHEHELHLAAALHEFQGGMPRHEAEARALEDYRREWHARAGAHHFAGMKASHAVGNMEDAKRHHALYALHVRALGEDPMGPVPESVRKYHSGAGTDKQPHAYRFHGHDADEYLIQPVTKHELELVDLKKAEPTAQDRMEALRVAANKVAGWCDLTGYFNELAKGDVVDLRSGQTIPPPERMPPDWVPTRATCDNIENCQSGNERYAAEVEPGFALCRDCLNKSRAAAGKGPYDPEEYRKMGFASPEEMNRAKVTSAFSQAIQTMSEDARQAQAANKPRPRHLTVVKSEDPVKLAAAKLRQTLETIQLAKQTIELLKKK